MTHLSILQSLLSETTELNALEFCTQNAEVLAQLPRVRPFCGAIGSLGKVNGKQVRIGGSARTNAEVRSAYTALAGVLRVDIEALLRVSHPLPRFQGPNANDTSRAAIEAALTRGVMVRVVPPVPEGATKSAKPKTAKAAKGAKGEKAERVTNTVPMVIPARSTMAKEQYPAAIAAFFATVRHVAGAAHAAYPRDGEVDTKLLDKRLFTVQAPGGIDPIECIERHADLLSAHGGTWGCYTQYRNGMLNAHRMIEIARRVFGEIAKGPYVAPKPVTGTARQPAGIPTNETKAARLAADAYVRDMAVLNLTIQNPLTYPIADSLATERKASKARVKATEKADRLSKSLVGGTAEIDRLASRAANRANGMARNTAHD